MAAKRRLDWRDLTGAVFVGLIVGTIITFSALRPSVKPCPICPVCQTPPEPVPPRKPDPRPATEPCHSGQRPPEPVPAPKPEPQASNEPCHYVQTLVVDCSGRK